MCINEECFFLLILNFVYLEYYNRHKDDILLQFYLTLKRILEDNQMHMMCELVFYEGKPSFS